MTGEIIVGCVLTLNEAANIADVVVSLRAVAQHVVVIDSESHDATARIASDLGATVWSRPFDTYSAQRNWALEQLSMNFGDVWCLVLDADERLTPALTNEITELWRAGRAAGVDGFLVPLEVEFCGRVLRHGGFQNTKLLRLFRVAAAQYEARDVNEHVHLGEQARMGVLRSPIVHLDVRSWEDYITKHNRYSTLEARARVRSGGTSVPTTQAIRGKHLRRRWLRERVFQRLPARPAIRFFQIYVVMLGFLDGAAGFRRALFEAWQELCIDLKAERLLEEASDGHG